VDNSGTCLVDREIAGHNGVKRSPSAVENPKPHPHFGVTGLLTKAEFQEDV
jgi:hypothetical protein